MYWSPQYASLHVLAIIVSVALALMAFVWPRLARVGYAVLFGWAAWANWHALAHYPALYRDYGDLAVSGLYVEFIRGFFAYHVMFFVGAVVLCEMLVVAGLIWGGDFARVVLFGAILFLIALAPLGVGSGFPATLIMAVGAARLMFAREALEGRPWSNVVRWGRPPRHA